MVTGFPLSRELPSNIDFKVECMTFEEAWRMHYPRFLRGNRLIPTFAFIDPFGWKGIPFAIVRAGHAAPQL